MHVRTRWREHVSTVKTPPARRVAGHGGPTLPGRTLRPWTSAWDSGWLPVVLLTTCAVSALTTGAAVWNEADISTAWGMFPVLDGWFVAAAVLFTAAFMLGIICRVHAGMLVLALVGWIVLLHGLPALIESEPRFSTAYIHVGIAEHIATTGELPPPIDARVSWPGAFALFALMGGLAGERSLLWLVPWAPVVCNLVYCTATWVIGAAAGLDVPRRWLALWLLVAFNWVGQDYLAPQAVAFGLHLGVLAMALVIFPQVRAATAAPFKVTAASRRVALLLLLVLACAAVVVTHQLTPVLMTVLLVALAWRDIRVLWLWTIVGTLFVTWVSVGAESWWIGHIGALVGEVGEVGGNVGSSVVARTQVPTSRLWVIGTRLAMTGGGLAVAAIGLWRARRAGGRWRLLGLLLAVPFVLVLGQSYGGEIVLRTTFFATPAIALCSVVTLTGLRDGVPTSREWTAVVATLALLVPAFLIARYGNEAFERIPSQDRAMVEALYAEAPPGALVVGPTSNLPWQDRGFAEYEFRSLSDHDLEEVSFDGVDRAEFAEFLDIVTEEDRAVYVLLSDNAARFATAIAGAPDDWLSDWRGHLDASPRFERAATEGDAVLYRLRGER